MSTPATETTTAPLIPATNSRPERRARTTATFAMLLGCFAGRRGASMLVRETAARQLEQRRADWGYSMPAIALDIVWNFAFVVFTVLMLLWTAPEKPIVPLRVWICGYALQGVGHTVLVCLEYRKRNRRVAEEQRTSGSSSSIESGNSNRNRLFNSKIYSKKRKRYNPGGKLTSKMEMFKILWDGGKYLLPNRFFCSRCTMHPLTDTLYFGIFSDANGWDNLITVLSCMWWMLGFYWVLSAEEYLLQYAPRLYWLTLAYLAIDVFIAIFFVLVACLLGIAACCCLPCIIAFLYIIAGQDGASEEDVGILPKYRFEASSDEEQPDGGASGRMVLIEPNGQDSSVGRVLLDEDADCCICLCTYENGTELLSLPCNHHFHATCIEKWLKINATCPLCKYNIKQNEDVF